MADVGWGGASWGVDPNTGRQVQNGTAYQQNADTARYNGISDQAQNRDISNQWTGGFDKSNATYGQASGYLDQDLNDANGQQSGIAETYARANGTAPSQGTAAADQALRQSIDNQRTAAASSPGGALAQASGLRNVSQSTAGQNAQGAMQDKVIQAQEQSAAQQAYATQVGQAQQQNQANDTNRQALSGMYAQNAGSQANLQASQRQNNQAQDLWGQTMATNVNSQAMQAQQQNADIAEKERENRRTDKQNQNSAQAKVIGGVTGAIGGALGHIFSDERTKKSTSWGVVGMDDPNLRIGEDDRGYIAQNEAPEQPSIASHFSARGDTPEPAKKAPPRPQPARNMTPEELMAAADKEIASVNADSARRQAEGPAVRRAGGGTRENGYNTQLTQGAEEAYRNKFGTNSDRDYDLRGAFAAGLTDGANTQKNDRGGSYFPNHLPDTYKKPNHETFSNESQYAKDAPQRAGSWKGDEFKPAEGSYEDLVNPWIHKYPGPAVPSGEHPDQGPDDNSVDYGDFDDDILAYGQPSMSYGRRTGGLAYGGRRG